MSNIDNRKDALKWWRKLSSPAKDEMIKKHAHNRSFHFINGSSFQIEQIYKKDNKISS